MECPRCRLISPESATRCDCGYNFQTASVESAVPARPVDDDSPLKRTPLPQMWIGFVLSALMLASEFLDVGTLPGTQANVFFFILVLITWSYWLWCVHRYHDIMTSIPGYRHPITPGQAVARHFIPFYNF